MPTSRKPHCCSNGLLGLDLSAAQSAYHDTVRLWVNGNTERETDRRLTDEELLSSRGMQANVLKHSFDKNHGCAIQCFLVIDI